RSPTLRTPRPTPRRSERTAAGAQCGPGGPDHACPVSGDALDAPPGPARPRGVQFPAAPRPVPPRPGAGAALSGVVAGAGLYRRPPLSRPAAAPPGDGYPRPVGAQVPLPPLVAGRTPGRLPRRDRGVDAPFSRSHLPLVVQPDRGQHGP